MSILNAFSPRAEPYCVKAMPVMFTTISPPPSPRLVHRDAQKRSVGRQREGAFMSSCRRNSPRILSSLGFPTTSKSCKTQGRAPGAMASPSGSSKATGKPRGRDGRPRREEDDVTPEEKRLRLLLEEGSAQPDDGEDAPRPGRKETGTQTGGDGRGPLPQSPLLESGIGNHICFSPRTARKTRLDGR
eukprot:XP_024304552.1 uncharacterized protein LOC112268076 [Homo sapiens]